jgi:hypothetical protein
MAETAKTCFAVSIGSLRASSSLNAIQLKKLRERKKPPV